MNSQPPDFPLLNNPSFQTHVNYDATRLIDYPLLDKQFKKLFMNCKDLPRSLLELGVGTGRIAHYFSKQLFSVYGIDTSSLMLQRLVEKRINVLPIKATALTVPLKSESVDAALAIHFFHLLPSWKTVLKELYRVLKPKGCFLFGSIRVELQDKAILKAYFNQPVTRSPTPQMIDSQLKFLGFQWLFSFKDCQSSTLNGWPIVKGYLSRSFHDQWNFSIEEHEARATRMAQYLDRHYPFKDHPLPTNQIVELFVYYKP